MNSLTWVYNNGVMYMFGEHYEWKPGANTVAYYPLEKDTNDYSWNNRNATEIWAWVTFTTSTDWYKCANFTWNTNSYIRYWSQWSSLNTSNTDITVCFWAWDIVNNTWFNYSMINWIIQWKKATDNNIIIWIWANSQTTGTWYLCMQMLTTNKALYNANLFGSSWMHSYVIVFNKNWTYKSYRDWVEQVSSTYPTTNLNWDMWIIWWNEWSTEAQRYYKWKLSNVILENKARTAKEIADYYNWTKKNYQ